MKRRLLLLALVGLGAVLVPRAAGDPSGAPNARIRVQLEPSSRPATLLRADDVIRSAHLPGESKPVTRPERIQAATAWTQPPGYSFDVVIERAGHTRRVTLALLPRSRWKAPPPRP